MFRISERSNGAGRVALLLEGRLVGPWVPEFRTHCERFLRDGLRLSLDFNEVSFVDRPGIAALRDLAKRGVEIRHLPLFLSDELREGVA